LEDSFGEKWLFSQYHDFGSDNSEQILNILFAMFLKQQGVLAQPLSLPTNFNNTITASEVGHLYR